MSESINKFGSFDVPFHANNEQGLFSIHPEMAPAKIGINPTGRYQVYCVHPANGSCSFIVEQDDEGEWYTEHRPQIISQEFIEWIGILIIHTPT